MEVLKGIIRLGSYLLLETEVYVVGRVTAGDWRRRRGGTVKRCSVRVLNEDLKERRAEREKERYTMKIRNNRLE